MPSAKELGFTLEFEGTGTSEIGFVKDISREKQPKVAIGDIIVRVDQKYFRPTEVETLLGDPSKNKSQTRWEPTTSAVELCREMTLNDLRLAQASLNRMK